MYNPSQFEPLPSGDPYPRCCRRCCVSSSPPSGPSGSSGDAALSMRSFPTAYLLPDLLFSIIACILTAAGYAICLRILDYNPYPLPIALALPLDPSPFGNGPPGSGSEACSSPPTFSALRSSDRSASIFIPAVSCCCVWPPSPCCLFCSPDGGAFLPRLSLPEAHRSLRRILGRHLALHPLRRRSSLEPWLRGLDQLGILQHSRSRSALSNRSHPQRLALASLWPALRLELFSRRCLRPSRQRTERFFLLRLPPRFTALACSPEATTARRPAPPAPSSLSWLCRCSGGLTSRVNIQHRPPSLPSRSGI